jgi:hypothetical protein
MLKGTNCNNVSLFVLADAMTHCIFDEWLQNKSRDRAVEHTGIDLKVESKPIPKTALLNADVLLQKIWPQPSWIESWNVDGSFTSMGPRAGPAISNWKKPCFQRQNGSEFPELAAQNFRNPQAPGRRDARAEIHIRRHTVLAFTSTMRAL